jgi:hypothetical protein
MTSVLSEPAVNKIPAPGAPEITYDYPDVTHRDWHGDNRFKVVEVPCPLDGRGFVVTPEGFRTQQVFDVFVSQRAPDHFCTCQVCDNYGTCCHLESILHLIDTGELQHPMASAPHEPHPSPEQLAAEAGVELPF